VRCGAINSAIGRVKQTAAYVETAHRNLRNRIRIIGRDGCCRQRTLRIGVKPVHGASIFFVVRAVMIETDSEIQREVPFHPPVILQEGREVVLIVGARGIQVELAAGGQPQQERAKSCPRTTVDEALLDAFTQLLPLKEKLPAEEP
jgi:hypothetical protein